ncbi:arylsulfatase [Thermostilla marina]
MKIRLLTVVASVCCAAIQNVGTGFAAEKPALRPNVVFILADDLGFGHLGCYGGKTIRTPHLDRLAADGLRFTRFHAGASLCLPSRCSLMTGLHTGHTRCRVNGGRGRHPEIAEEDITLARVLQRAGYSTAMIGKWSLGDDFRGCVVKEHDRDGTGAIYKHGWEYYFGEPNQTYCHEYFPLQLYRFDPHGMLGPATPDDRLEVVPLRNGDDRKLDYTHDLLVDRTLRFLEAAAEAERPFFLYLSLTVPHADFVVPQLDPYTVDRPWPEAAKAFASMITRMDRDVGRIRRTLESLGIAEDTLVIFTSDNGGFPQFDEIFDNNGPLEGFKGQEKVGGVRVPCIAYWPGTIRPGRVSDELLAFWDVMPTLAELAGTETPQPIDGVSFVPTLLEKGEQEHHRYLYFRRASAKDYLVIRGEGETRSDEAIAAEAEGEVVVPTFSDRP